MTLRPRQLTQASFLQKNQTLQNGFLISVMQRWHRASVVCKNQSFLSWSFHSSIIFLPKLRSVAQNEWKKHPYIFFLLLVQKKWVWAEKIGKKRKNSRNLKVAGNYPNTSYSIQNQNDQLLKLWFLQATETLCHLSVTDIKKLFCNVWFFCINEPSVNCGKENTTNLTWLLWGISFHADSRPIGHKFHLGLGNDLLLKSILGQCEK